MSLPTPDWNGVELRWRGMMIDGKPAEGRLVITADVPRFLDDDPAQATSIFAGPIYIPIGADGTASMVVPATDDPDVTPTGFTYTVREELTKGAGSTYTVAAPLSAAVDGIDLNRIVSIDPSPGTPVEPVSRAEFDALAYTFVRKDQVAIALDTDGTPYWGNDIALDDALRTATDADGVPYVVTDENEPPFIVGRDLPNGVAPLDENRLLLEENLPARLSESGLSATYEAKVPRAGATTGQVPALQADGSLAFADLPTGGGGGTASVTLETLPITRTAFGANTWTTKAALPTLRQALGGAQVDGKIYAIGGETSAGGYSTATETYDPGANTWVSKAAMLTGRHEMGAAAAQNGNIYAIGGWTSAISGANEMYDPVANTWTAKAAMPTPRRRVAGGVVSVSGTVYVIGGDSGSTSALNEAYDTATNTWTTKAAMTSARYDLMAVAVGGLIYAVGGWNSAYVATNEMYDPVANTWTAKAAMTTARRAAGAAVVSGNVYVVGGTSGGYLATNEMYDPVANTWTAKAAMTTARRHLTVAASGGKVYAVGGEASGGVFQTATESYDPVANTWTAVSGMSVSRRALASATTADGKIHAIGGEELRITAANEMYDPVTDTWTTKAAMPTARSRFGCAAVSGKVYAIGGWSKAGVVSTINEVYDPTSNTWVVKAPMPTARQNLASVEASGKIYAFGGQNGTTTVTNNEMYDPVANTWTAKAVLPSSRQGVGASTQDGKVYVMGGQNGSGTYLATNEMFDPAANTWTTKAALPTARRGLAIVAALDGRVYAMGGTTATATTTAANDSYDPLTNTWTTAGEATSIPSSRFEFAGVLAADGKIFAIGGWSSTGGTSLTPNNTVYDPGIVVLDPICTLGAPGLLVSLVNGISLRNKETSQIASSVGGATGQHIYPYGPSVDDKSATTITIVRIGG